MVRSVSINFHPNDWGSLQLIRDIVRFAQSHGADALLPDYEILASAGLEKYVCSDERYVRSADLVIAVGGDGTFLRTARLFSDTGKPIFGINRGRLGFLTEFSPEEYPKYLEGVFNGTLAVTERITLQAEIITGKTRRSTLCFINDAVISKGALSRAITVELEVDGHYLNSFSGDGLIISTPTGSTAYSLSAGGPIITPTSADVLCITPVCPHTLGMRPMIVPAASVLKARIMTEERNLLLTIDGQEAISVGSDDEIVFSRSGKKIFVVMHPEKNFYAILREKLGWG